MSEQEVCSLGIRDCRYGCTYCQDAAKVEGHWGRRKYGSGRWEELDGDPVELENGFIYKFFPNFVPAVATPVPTDINKLQDEVSEDKVEGHWEVQLNATLWVKIDFVPDEWQFATYPNKYRFVPAVATPVPTGCCPKPVDTDEEVLNYKIENQRIELNRINIQLHRTLVKMDEANSYINKLQDEVSEAKESTQPTTAASLIVELECMRGSNSYSEYPKIWEDGFNYCKSSAIWRAKSHALVEENAIRKDEQKEIEGRLNLELIKEMSIILIKNEMEDGIRSQALLEILVLIHAKCAKESRELHWAFSVYDECNHEHTEEDVATGLAKDISEVGYVCEEGLLYQVCGTCCCHPDDGQTDFCNDHHGHGKDIPICPSIKLADKWEWK
jgi:hypothetical protein